LRLAVRRLLINTLPVRHYLLRLLGDYLYRTNTRDITHYTICDDLVITEVFLFHITAVTLGPQCSPTVCAVRSSVARPLSGVYVCY